jgi:outer membrane protein assembly factor BamD
MRIRRFLGIIALLLVCACAGRQLKPDMTAEEIYQAAQAEVEKRDYDEAQKLFDRIRDEYPFSKFAVEAELLAADSAFRQEKWEEAAASYRSFEELHPTHPSVAYAIYRRGLAQMKLASPDDRDQTATRKALEAFQKLLNAYPGSEYASEARLKLEEARFSLAAHELYVAQYYARKKEYDAALARLRDLVRDYPDTPHRDEALRLATEIKARKEGATRGK